MAIETLVKTVFSDEFRKERWEDLNAGKLLDPQFKKDMQYGDEVDVQFHDPLTMSDYEGGDLDIDTVEKAGTSTVKVKINKGKSVFFKLDEAKLRQIKSAKTNDEKIKLIKEYSADAREQFDRAIDKACCEQRIRAKMLENNKAITVSDTNIHQIFASAKTALVIGDDKGHTAWKDGEMIAVISPKMEAFMSTMKILQYSDVMAKHYKKGFVGTFMGFAVVVDNNLDKTTETTDGGTVTYEYPLFGRAKRTIAGGIQDDFKLESGKKVGGFDTHYWGKGVFGVKAPLSYLLVSAKCLVNFTIGS